MIEYRGRQYETRDLYRGKYKGYVTVSTVDLMDKLFPNGSDAKRVSKEAQQIDEQIVFYCEPDEWKLSDKELLKLIYRENEGK